MSGFVDLTGKRFGMLTVTGPSRDHNNKIVWLCRCDCGKDHVVTGGNLQRKIAGTKSCGCLKQAPPPNKEKNRVLAIERNRYNAAIKCRSKLVLGMDVGLTLSQYQHLIYEPCHYCGLSRQNSTTDNRGEGLENITIWHNGIDRIDSSLGYTFENCVSCCKRCNLGKNDLSQSDFLAWIRRVYEQQFIPTPKTD